MRAGTNKLSRQPSRRGCDPRPLRAFSLVELLIVVLILGILAAIIVPQFTDMTGDAKLNTLTRQLELVRKQIEVYRVQHNGAVPTFVQFTAQMTGKTNPDGSLTGSPGFGPYLQQIPINPFTGNRSLGIGSIGTSSWSYDETTGEFKANCHAAHSTL